MIKPIERLGRGRVGELAEPAAAPDLRHPVPAVAGQQRHRVDHDELLDQLRAPLGADQRQAAPVVDDQLAPPDPELVEALSRKAESPYIE